MTPMGADKNQNQTQDRHCEEHPIPVIARSGVCDEAISSSDRLRTRGGATRISAGEDARPTCSLFGFGFFRRRRRCKAFRGELAERVTGLRGAFVEIECGVAVALLFFVYAA